MPYAFAHPAAVIPLYRPLGKFAAPSALVIGSVVPDAWYFVPGLLRNDSHSALGLLLFCLPVGLLAYVAFHLLLKQPLLALLPAPWARRLAAFTSAALPPVPWPAVVVSLAAGAATHLAWDALTHAHTLADRTRQLLQHGSTLAGTAFLLWWLRARLRSPAPAAAAPCEPVAPPARRLILGFFLSVGAAAFCSVLFLGAQAPLSIEAARSLLRAAAVIALSTAGFAVLAYCLWWRRQWGRAQAGSITSTGVS